MYRTEPSLIQAQALQLAEKINQLVEHNEKILDMKNTGANSYFNTYQQRTQYGLLLTN